MDAVCSRICRYKFADPILPCHVDSMNDFETFVRASQIYIVYLMPSLRGLLVTGVKSMIHV